MRKSTVELLLGAALFGSLLSGSIATTAVAGTLDQSSTSGDGNAGGIGYADTILGPQVQLAHFGQGQTFTDGIGGVLDQAELYLRRDCADPLDDLSVQVRTTSGSPVVPTDTVLAAATLPAANVPLSSPEWVTVQFPTPATVSPGTLYALVATSDGYCPSVANPDQLPGYHWGGTDLDFYLGGTWVSTPFFTGTGWQARGGDLAFKTYVAAPPPPPPPPPPVTTGDPPNGTTTAPGQRAAALKKCKKKQSKKARSKCRKKATNLPA